uniref:hypothetical protein n=1 Tax=Gordonia sp. B7-2 TaxID=3420932 RepID=UPI003D8D0512
MIELASSRTSPADLQTYLRVHGVHLGVLRVINAAPGSKWRIDLSFIDDAIEVAVYPPDGVKVGELIDGRFPELMWGDTLELEGENERVCIDPQNLSVILREHAESSGQRIIIGNYGRDRSLSPSFARRTEIIRYLERRTWLGGTRYRATSGRLKLRVLTEKREFAPASLQDEVQVVREYTQYLTVDNTKMSIHFTNERSAIDVRVDKIGQLVDQTVFSRLIDALRSRLTKYFTIELQTGWPFEIGPLGEIVQSSRIEDLLDRYIEASLNDQALDRFREDLNKVDLARQANLLNDRIDVAMRSSKIEIHGRDLGCIPVSEQGTVAIIHKLEGLGALPFCEFTTVGWAGHEGIDAIAHLQFNADSPRIMYAPVEYEYLFRNFIAHGHPIQHVRLIICWDDEGDERLDPTGKSWLLEYSLNGYSVPVLVLRRIPNLLIVPTMSKE